MRKLIVLLSGEICVGKSSLSQNLVKQNDFKILSSEESLSKIAQEQGEYFNGDSLKLKEFEESLEKKTSGKWLCGFYQDKLNKTEKIVVDSVNSKFQIDSFREAYGHSVIHIHLKCPEIILLKRFIEKSNNNSQIDIRTTQYNKIKQTQNERFISTLEKIADIVIETNKNCIKDALTLAQSHLKLLPPINQQLIDVLVGGQFGSEGKGQVAAFLASGYDALIRVGGPNAGHKVYSEPESITFHLLPSGTCKNPKAQLIIGPGAVLNENILLKEIKKFGINEPSRLIIDPNATIISEEDRKFEREQDKIGSTAQGVGKATAENIINRLKGTEKFKAKNCSRLKQYIKPCHEVYEKLFSQNKKILLEGTQGSLLSLHHGLYPHVTSRETTATGCLAEAGIGLSRVRKIIMVTRTYPIRVQNPENGTSGDFRSIEIDLKEISSRSGIPIEELEKTETTSTTQRKRRIAEFSWHLFRKSCELNTPTDIALTFVDYIDVKNRKARRFDQLTSETTKFIEEIERCSSVPVSLIATRFDYRSIIDRRNWV